MGHVFCVEMKQREDKFVNDEWKIQRSHDWSVLELQS